MAATVANTARKGTAAEEFFNNPELLEQVLLRFKSRELVVMQRVSRQFQAMILETPKIQTALCLRSCNAGKEGSTTAESKPPSEIVKYWRSFHWADHRFTPAHWKAKYLHFYGNIEATFDLNNMFTHIFPRVKLSDRSLQHEDWDAEGLLFDPTTMKLGSWQSMYLTQPPIKKIKAPLCFRDNKVKGSRDIYVGRLDEIPEKSIVNENGITMGDFLAWGQRQLASEGLERMIIGYRRNSPRLYDSE